MNIKPALNTLDRIQKRNLDIALDHQDVVSEGCRAHARFYGAIRDLLEQFHGDMKKKDCKCKKCQVIREAIAATEGLG